MNIYLSHDLETKLRQWARENNRTINSIVIEGLGKILMTVSKTPEEDKSTNREVQNLDKKEIQYCEIGLFLQDLSSCSEEGTISYLVPEETIMYMNGGRKDKVMLCKEHYVQITTNA